MSSHKAEYAKMRLLQHARFLDAPVITLKRYSKAEVAAAVAEAKERDKAKARALVMEQLIQPNDIYGDGDI